MAESTKFNHAQSPSSITMHLGPSKEDLRQLARFENYLDETLKGANLNDLLKLAQVLHEENPSQDCQTSCADPARTTVPLQSQKHLAAKCNELQTELFQCVNKILGWCGDLKEVIRQAIDQGLKLNPELQRLWEKALHGDNTALLDLAKALSQDNQLDSSIKNTLAGCLSKIASLEAELKSAIRHEVRGGATKGSGRDRVQKSIYALLNIRALGITLPKNEPPARPPTSHLDFLKPFWSEAERAKELEQAKKFSQALSECLDKMAQAEREEHEKREKKAEEEDLDKRQEEKLIHELLRNYPELLQTPYITELRRQPLWDPPGPITLQYLIDLARRLAAKKAAL